MGWNQFVKDYFTFSRKDRIAFIALSIAIILLLIIPKYFSSTQTEYIQVNPQLADAIDSLQSNNVSSVDEVHTNELQYERSITRDFNEGELFAFDPNTLSLEGWGRLGLSDRTIKTINNYRSKGGRFYKKEDLQKIWGLPAGFYKRVQSYINITSPTKKYEPFPEKSSVPYERKERKFAIVSINNADTASLIALPGIGSKLAARIVNFREKLGGFHSVDQIGETYGLPDSTFQKIKPYLKVDVAAVRKININTATKDELKMHPYIKWNLANAIVEYRTQHGNFKSLDELRKIVLMDEATFNKIVLYLSL